MNWLLASRGLSRYLGLWGPFYRAFYGPSRLEKINRSLDGLKKNKTEIRGTRTCVELFSICIFFPPKVYYIEMKERKKVQLE